MKLRVLGSIHEFAKSAKFDNVYDDLPSMLGKRLSQAVPDTALLVEEIGKDSIRFSYIHGDRADSITLKLGETYDARHEGNAYGYEVHVTLSE